MEPINTMKIRNRRTSPIGLRDGQAYTSLGRRFKSCHSDQHLDQSHQRSGTDCGTDIAAPVPHLHANYARRARSFSRQVRNGSSGGGDC